MVRTYAKRLFIAIVERAARELRLCHLLPIVLIAFATYVTALATNVADLASSFGAVACNVAGLVAIVATLKSKTSGIVATLWAAACHVTSFVAVVTVHLGSLLAVFCNVSYTVATVAEVLILFAFTCKVTKLVALEALLTSTSKSTISITASTTIASTPAGITTLGALPREMAHPVAFVASTRTHLYLLLISLTR